MQNIVKTWSRVIWSDTVYIALKFNGPLGNVAAEVSVNLESNWNNLTPNLATLIIHEILRQGALPFMNGGSGWCHILL